MYEGVLQWSVSDCGGGGGVVHIWIKVHTDTDHPWHHPVQLSGAGTDSLVKKVSSLKIFQIFYW